jgi:signal transduction histidine kinase
MRETIRVRLTLWYAGFLAALLLVFAGIVAAAEHRNETIELDAMLRATARGAEKWLQPSVSVQHLQEITELAGAGHPEELLCLRLITPDGRPLRIIGDARLARQIPIAHSWPVEGVAETVRLSSGERVRVYRETQSRDARRKIRVEAVGVNSDHRELVRLLGAIALAAPPMLGLAVLMGLFLAGRALQPMEAVTRTARELSAGDLSRRIALPGPNDEIKQLADTFDAMLTRLEAAFRSQQSFVADASHELRTPLAILQGHADLALSDPHEDPRQCRRALEVVSAEVRRLSRMVASLLTLARADAGSLTVLSEPVDLMELCEETLCRMRPLAGARTLACEGPSTLVTLGDADWLRQLLLNLIENAIHHTAPDGQIRVAMALSGSNTLLGAKTAPAGGPYMTRSNTLLGATTAPAGGPFLTGESVRVEVRDDGCGIASEHLPHLFDRFYRVDKARSRAHGGAGLGLSIARWIVERHGGAIQITSQPGVGTVVVVRLPAPSSTDGVMG